MWPFSKKAPVPESLPIDGAWSINQGTHNGSDLIVRSNSGYKIYCPIAGYEHQVGIAVPFRIPEPTGLPSRQEYAELGGIEKALCEELEFNAESLLVAVITTGGMQEFVFYTRDPDQVRRRFDFLKKRIATHQIQLMIQQDKRWKVYARFS